MSVTHECGVCWWGFDPTVGEPVWQIEPGVEFEALPGLWRCPRCDAGRERFVAVVERRAGGAEGRAPGAERRAPNPAGGGARAEGRRARETRGQDLVAAYRRVEPGMRELPIVNPAVKVAAVGPGRLLVTPVGPAELWVITTPWAMNAVLVPPAGTRWVELRDGAAVEVVLPSGPLEWIAGRLDGVGPTLSCSLFSPMEVFADDAVARETAAAAFELLAGPAPAPAAAPSRRALLGLGRGGER